MLLLSGYSFAAPPAKASAKAVPPPAKVSGFAAQVAAAKAKRDSLARLDSLIRLDSIARHMESVRLDSIDRAVESDRQDSIAKVETARRDSVARVEAARRDSVARVEAARQDSIARAEAMARANAPPYPHYEAYLDSMEAYVRYLLPGIDRLDSAKKAVREETLKPKSDYESKTAYEERAANFDKNKQKKIENLENEYLEKEKGIGRLVNAAVLKEDFQPDWGSLLEKNSNADGYKARIDTISFKITEMRVKIAQLNKQLGRLFLYNRDSVKIAKNLREKNYSYIARLENAKVVLQDYILQEHAKVLRTDRKKVDMSLGAYDVDKQEFDLGMRDIYSEKYPFDYVGKVKISTQQAEVIDRRTDDFTVSIDYINYPFMIKGAKTFPGAKKAYIFWKDQEFPNDGVFRNVPGFDEVPGYLEWALRADSLISGKLVPQDLDASFAMQRVKYREDSGPSWWTAPRIVRVLAFTLSAVSLGGAIFYHRKANTKRDEVEAIFRDAEASMFNEDYKEKYDTYNTQKNELKDIETKRNILYISAGTFGVIGAVSFAF
jgi:hypothetical protein